MGDRKAAAVDAAAQWLRKHFDADAAQGFSGVFVLDLTGASGGALTVHVADGVLSTSPGAAPYRDVRIGIDADDFLDVLAGRANGELLHMAGRVQIEGASALVLRLQTLFRRRV